MTTPGDEPPTRLIRALDTRRAVVVGLGAMLGTGVFAVWTPAYAAAGPALLAAVVLAGTVAFLNALSTARLAAVHPESGGAYVYGRRRLGRPAGAFAGWCFVVGKAGSAGAAALTIGAYLAPGPVSGRAIAVLAVAAALALDLRGVVRSAAVTRVMVAFVLAVVAVVIGWVLADAWSPRTAVPLPYETAAAGAPDPTVGGTLAAAGLLFVAFAGYARIATLGEEVRDPARTIPRAIAISFAVVATVYVLLAVVILEAADVIPPLGAASLADLARGAGTRGGTSIVVALVGVAAVVAAFAVLLSLVAGIGRTLFAMAAGSDAPGVLDRVSPRHVPARAEMAAAGLALAVVAVGGIPFALGVSAVAVLAYYAVAHLAALRLGVDERRPPRALPVIGLLGCVVLAGAVLVDAVT